MQNQPKLLKHLFLFLCTFSLCANSHALVNGSFESGLTGWTFNSGVVISPYVPASIPASHGSNAVQLGINDISGSILSQSSPVVGGSTHVLAFDILALGDPGRTGVVRVELSFLPIGVGGITSQSFTNAARNTPPFLYQSKSVPFTIPANATNVVLRFADLSPTSGIAVDPIIDNVRITSGATNPLPPLIIAQPQSATVLVGTNVTFAVSVQSEPVVLPAVSSGNLRLWLKADAGVETSSAGGNQVVQWRDQSGTANHCSQTNANKRPLLIAAGLNGRPAIRFDGVQDVNLGDYLQGTGNVGLTAGFSSFMVYSKADRTVDEEVPVLIGVPFSYHSVRTFYIRSFLSVNNEMCFSAWGNDYGSGFHIPPLTPRIWTERLNATKTQIELFDTDGINNFVAIRATSGLLSPGSGYYVGGLGPQRRNLQGNIAEIIYYQGALSDADRLSVENYLRQKYFSPAGASLLTYQWRFNGTNISGATNSSFTLNNVQLSNAGNYSVVVSNLFASTLSSNALLTVIQPNRPPVAVSQSFSLNEDVATPLPLIANDADGDTLIYSVTLPSNGTLSGTAPNLTYTPNANFHGTDSFTFKVNDGEFDSAMATISITVISVNDAPLAVATASPSFLFSSNETSTVVIAPCDGNAIVVLDASLSSDIENDPLQFLWTEGTNVLGTSQIISNSFTVGTHSILLTVNDGSNSGFTTLIVEVITPAESVAELILFVEESNLPNNRKQPLIASLNAAVASFLRCHIIPGVNQLEAFQNKVRAQLAPLDAALAEELLHISNEIIGAVNSNLEPPMKPEKGTKKPRNLR